MSSTTGRRSAVAAMLFMRPDMSPAVSIMSPVTRTGESPARRITWAPTRFATPVRYRPPLSTSTAAIVTTAGFANPSMARDMGITPLIASARRTMSATPS